MNNEIKSEKIFYALGTQNSIIAYRQKADDIISKAVNRVLQIHSRMSAYDPNSEISQIIENAGKKPVKISDDVLYVLENALMFSQQSKGAFDITIRPLKNLWKTAVGSGVLPSHDEIVVAKQLIGWKNLIINQHNKTAFLQKPGQAIDLGGIAKGYAADEVKRILLEGGVASAIINLGGNIITLGTKEDGEPWMIGIQNPLAQRGEYAVSIKVQDKSVVTSAVNEQFFVKDSKRYHHIIDPVTGYPVENELLSVTIIADNSTLADALSTTVFVLGVERGLKLIKDSKSEAVFIMKNGDIFSTFDI